MTSKQDKFKGNYSVYIHVCPNEMIYVGITGKDPERRWRNGEGYKHQPLFYNAIQCYGWSNIQHILVDEFDDKSEALVLERKLIKNNKENCYNIKGLSSTKFAEYDFKHRNKIKGDYLS